MDDVCESSYFVGDMNYVLRRARQFPDLADSFDSPSWSSADVIRIDRFHPQSSDHHPKTQVRMLWSDRDFFVIFQIDDRFVRCTRDRYQEPVYKDSCVEFFIKPKSGQGYFNFEMNCGGTMLLYYIEDPAPGVEAEFRKFVLVAEDLGRLVRIRSSLPKRVEPEITTSIRWELSARVPLDVIEAHVGPLKPAAGEVWRGNFFKCGDETSHPHWASWSPIGQVLRFHQPDRFGTLTLAE